MATTLMQDHLQEVNQQSWDVATIPSHKQYSWYNDSAGLI